MKKLFVILMIVVCFYLSLGREVSAQSFSSPNVPIDDPVYRDIDKLVAFGLIKDAIYGQRPWSRGEIVRMIGEAMRNQESQGAPLTPVEQEIAPRVAADEILERLKKQYQEELIDHGVIDGEKKSVRIHPLDRVDFDYTLLDSPPRIVPVNNGLGAIDAVINPLIAYREGRHYVDGSTLGLETTHRAKLSRYFSIYARPRFEVLVPNTGSTDVNPIVQQLYGKFTYRNFELEAGRDSLIWGQGEFGGVLSSNNARPLDMIKISNDSPFYHPWIFKYLGPSKYTFFVANLGPETIFKNAYVYGLTVTIKPVAFLEMGIEHQVTVGGIGSPSIGVTDLLTEFFLFRRTGAHNNSGPNLADHRVGANLRINLPFLRGSSFYAEGIFEDLGRESFFPQFTEQMAFQSGLYVPLLTPDGSNSLRIEYEHIPGSYGRHGTWTSGLSLNQRLRGSELGPDGQSLLVDWTHDFSNRLRFRSCFQYANRDSDLYSATISSAGGPDRVFKKTDNPTEHRFRFETSLRWDFNPYIRIQPQFGYEHVENFSFTQGDDRENLLGRLQINFFPEKFLRRRSL